MLIESQKLEKEINELQSQINELPEGKIFCTRNGNHPKWFHSDGHTHSYIPKKNRQLAEQLAIKKYLLLLQKDLLHEKTAIDFYLRHHNTNINMAHHMLTDMPEYQELLSPFFQLTSPDSISWMNAPYEHNTSHPEQLVHKSSSGRLVRSKSEAMIDMLLYINQIPFRYECSIELGQVTIFPDFTIRHPQTKEIYYWEHFGLMDDPSYSKNAYSKLQLYTSAGIIPGINLITTFETKNHPLSFDTIKKTIELYFS